MDNRLSLLVVLKLKRRARPFEILVVVELPVVEALDQLSVDGVEIVRFVVLQKAGDLTQGENPVEGLLGAELCMETFCHVFV